MKILGKLMTEDTVTSLYHRLLIVMAIVAIMTPIIGLFWLPKVLVYAIVGFTEFVIFGSTLVFA